MNERPIDVLLAEYEAEARSHEKRVVEQACREHPEHAERIRSAFLNSERAQLRAPAPSGAQHVGPYRLLSELGRGGQAVVYLAEDTRLRRQVALKILKGFGPLSEKVIERFRREAEVTSKLDHPGICAVYDAGVESGVPYIAMRLVHGATLAARISEAKGSDEDFDVSVEKGPQRLKPAGVPNLRAAQVGVGAVAAGVTTTHQEVLAIVEVIEKAARALHAAHEAGVIHRDIKPGNIMVSPDGQPVILDFGLASDEEGDFPTLTQSGDLFGTPAYMSPEQLMAQRVRLDRRTDVYSLGVTLFECLALRQPFEAPTLEGMYQAIQYKEPPDIRKLNPRIPRDLKVVIETALQKDRDKRYATAQAFAEDLRRVRASEPITARPVGPIGRVVRFAKRRPAMAALIGVLILALPTIAGLGGFLAANWKEIEQQKQRTIDDELERHLESGYLELADGNPAKAIEAFDQGLLLKPQSPEALAGKAMALLRQGQADAVLKLFGGQAAGLGCEDALQTLRADALEKLGRKSDAEDLRGRIKTPTTPLGLFLAGQRDIESGDASPTRHMDFYRSAVGNLSDAVARAPVARLLYHMTLARAAGSAGDTGLVKQIVRALECLWPDSSTAWYQAGYALFRTNDCDGVLRANNRVLEIDPRHVKAHHNLAWALQCKKQIGEAIAEYKRAIELDPNYAVPHRSLGALFQEEKRIDEALFEFSRATSIDPQFAGAHNSLGSALYDEGRVDEAISEYRRAIDLDHTFAYPHGGLGIALRTQGRFREAAKESARAQELLGTREPRLTEWARADEEATRPLCRYEDRLDEILGGGSWPDDPQDLMSVAVVASGRDLHALATKMWLAAFTKQPGLRENPDEQWLDRAASSAVVAAGGGGKDAVGPDAKTKADLRQHALGWLADQMGMWTRLLQEEPTKARTKARWALERWKRDPKLATVRDPAELVKLPDAEREAWTKFWADVDERLKALHQ